MPTTMTGNAPSTSNAPSTIEEAMERVDQLEFKMLKQKLAKNKIWTEERIVRIEQSYRQFLALCLLYPDKRIVPTLAIDEFWHAHILDTRAYAADCKDTLGRCIHHYPYSGILRDVFQALLAKAISDDTKSLFIEHFGTNPFEDEFHALLRKQAEEAEPAKEAEVQT